MRATVWLTFGWVGFGASAGLLPELRLGLVALGCCRGAPRERVEMLRAGIRSAIATLAGGRD